MNTSASPILKWEVKKLVDLTPIELHDLLKVRIDVFVVEQECAYDELDGKDPACWHVLGKNEENRVVATSRIAPKDIVYSELSIGRVAIDKAYRSHGFGKTLMEVSKDYAEKHMDAKTIKIAAQEYLNKFYSELGYVQISDSYLWDGIPHIDMRLEVK